jgi:hypothetical protein
MDKSQIFVAAGQNFKVVCLRVSQINPATEVELLFCQQ